MDEAQCGTSMVESMKVSGTRFVDHGHGTLISSDGTTSWTKFQKVIENMGQENIGQLMMRPSRQWAFGKIMHF